MAVGLLAFMSFLIAMGMSDAFNAGAADFSAMSNDSSLFITQVIHETMLEMDEKGLIAAAVTVIMMAKSMSQLPSPVLFRALSKLDLTLEFPLLAGSRLSKFLHLHSSPVPLLLFISSGDAQPLECDYDHMCHVVYDRLSKQ